MLEVIVNAFFLAQALDEMQVGLVVLHAIVAFGVRRTEPEAKGIGLNAVLLEHLGDDPLHREVLEDALVGAMLQVGQLRAQGDLIARQPLARVALSDAMDQAMDAVAGR